MSQRMTECLGSPGDQNLNRCLSEALENLECEAISRSSLGVRLEQHIVATQLIGPFGVFHSRSSTTWTLNPSPAVSSPSRGASTDAEEGEYDEDNDGPNVDVAGNAPSTLEESLSLPGSMNMFAGGSSGSQDDLIPNGSASTSNLERVESIPETELAWENPMHHALTSLVTEDYDDCCHSEISEYDTATVAGNYSLTNGITLPEERGLSGDFVDTSTITVRSTSIQHRDTPRSLVNTYQLQQPWQDLSIPIDHSISSEIRILLTHFSSHLANLLSPILLPGPNIRSQTCLDQALLCFGRLSVFSDANVESSAVLYSLLAMSAAHMDAVYQDLRGNKKLGGVELSGRRGRREEGKWHESALRYMQLAQVSLDRMLLGERLSNREHKNALLTFMNMVNTVAISDLYQPLPDLFSRCVHFISHTSPRDTTQEPKSKTLLCLEYLLLQECVLNGSLSTLSPSPSPSTPSSPTELGPLYAREIWAQFLVAEGHGVASTSSERSISGTEGSMSASELRQQTGSPVPPSLLRLILENSFVLQKMKSGTETEDADEIARLETKICEWEMEEEELNDDTPDTSSVEDSSDANNESSDGSDSDDDEDIARGGSASPSQNIATPLTQAYHTSLLLLFFSYTKPTNPLLVSPLRRKLLKQLRAYVRGVEEAEVDVGVGGGIVWALKVLKGVGLDSSSDRKEARLLWEFVRGAGWRV